MHLVSNRWVLDTLRICSYSDDDDDDDDFAF
jgi:hypothetical protein